MPSSLWQRLLSRCIGTAPVAKLIVSTARRYWRLLLINTGSSLLQAFSEGLSLAVVFMAVQVLGSNGPIVWQANPLLSHSPWLLALISGVPRPTLFLALLAVAVALQLLQSAARYINGVSVGAFTARCRTLITSQVHQQILRLTYPCASGYRVGDLTDIASSGPYAIQAAINQYSQLLVDGLFTALYLVILLSLSPWLMLIAVALAGVIWLVQRKLLPRVRASAHSVSTAQMQIAVRITEDIQGLRLLHTTGQLQRADQAVRDSMAELERSQIAQTRLVELIGPISSLLPILAIAVIGASSLLLFGARTSGILPSLVTFVLALQRLNMRIGSIAGLFTGMSANAGPLHRLNSLLEPSDKQFVRHGGVPFSGLRKQIELDGVSLRYHADGPEALRQIDLVIPRGSTVALVGPSGSGKSSIADLLIGLYEPTAGSVQVDGHDLRSFSTASWQQHLGVVSQDTFLFNASIAANIAYGLSDVAEADVMAACTAAQCAGFIGSLPDGLNTLVGERGYRLSGGQRQRLALARAILRNPDLLILDEATSALDSQNERLVQRAIDRFQTNRTVLVIAHRLSTVVSADRIIVMQEGRIVQRGNHGSLLSTDGLYRQLWLEQSQKSDLDALTGLWSRAVSMRALERNLLQATRYPHRFAVVLVAAMAESNKASEEHQALDQLVRFSRQRLRESDFLGSLDDGRLLMILPYTSEHEAEHLAASLNQAVHGGELGSGIRLQHGVTTWRQGDTTASLLHRLEAHFAAQACLSSL